MIISIPSKYIIKEYNYLRNSQKKVNVNETSKKLDDYVYDKTNKFGNAKILGFLAIINSLFIYACISLKRGYALGEISFMNGIGSLMGLDMLHDNLKDKKRILNNKDEKQRMYLKNGINAVV